jgi:hypothetical protein
MGRAANIQIYQANKKPALGYLLLEHASLDRDHEGVFLVAINNSRYLAIAARSPSSPLSAPVSRFRGKRLNISHAEFSVYLRPGDMPGS